jgi:hypothetical protein
MAQFRGRLWTLFVFLRFMLWPMLRAWGQRRGLVPVLGAPKNRSVKGVVAVAAHYGNHDLIEPFLDHHRRVGVQDFVFLDLSADGGLAARLQGRQECAVWRPRGAWQSWQVIYWLNTLRGRYASNRWCLSLDTHDAFVFYRCETRRIADLTDFLETESRDHIYALIIEMYGAEPALAMPSAGSAPFLERLDHFDPCGFTSAEPGYNRDVVTRGGLQRRLLHKSQPGRSPALNRIPLVKWRWYYSYVSGTRLILPAYLNTPHVWWHSNPTACLLRFALLNDRSTLAIAADVEAHAIVEDDGMPAYEGLLKLLDRPLRQDFSQRYTGTSDLVDNGLLNPGQWF